MLWSRGMPQAAQPLQDTRPDPFLSTPALFPRALILTRVDGERTTKGGVQLIESDPDDLFVPFAPRHRHGGDLKVRLLVLHAEILDGAHTLRVIDHGIFPFELGHRDVFGL